jgi:hypothetical protein
MDVPVHYKLGQRQLRSPGRYSLLGSGLLERARSTSLALLGVTAAVGLAMVSLAVNQGWPLIAGAPIPGFGDQHQAVGKATIAASARPGSQGRVGRRASGKHGSAVSTHPSRQSGGTPAQPPGSAGNAVANSTPADSPAAGSPGPAPSPAPVAAQPAPSPPAPEPASSAPAASPPGSSPKSAPEAATPSQPSLASGDAGGHDHGHHFGRGVGGGHGHSHNEGDAAEAESVEKLEPEPPPAAPLAPSGGASEEPAAPQSPAWSHGGGHGAHDHGH